MPTTTPMTAAPRPRLRLAHPARTVVIAFAGAVAVGTALLSLPVATAGAGRASILTAWFTATSAVCVTGLIVVDTPTYWSAFGQVVILVLFQLGGFGIMTLGSVLALAVFRRVGLRHRMAAQAEINTLALGDVRRVLFGVLIVTAVIEVVTTLLLTVRFVTAYDEPVGRALWLGLFHAVSAFNNAGFSVFSDSLERFVADPWISFTVAVTFIVGGLGFPVLFEVHRRARAWRRWSVHTKLTLFVTAVLIAVGFITFLAFEWRNPGTLGPLDTPGKITGAFFQAVTPRTAGFNTTNYAFVGEPMLLVTIVLMFIGAGSAGTAGGIKVTTFALLGYVIWAELRGESEVTLFGRRAPATAQRQALAIALIGVGAVVIATLSLVTLAPTTMVPALFEAVSAFGTVGLSMGITPTLPDPARVLVIVLMFVGRLGPVTLGTALVLRERTTRYRLPEERPIIG